MPSRSFLVFALLTVGCAASSTRNVVVEPGRCPASTAAPTATATRVHLRIDHEDRVTALRLMHVHYFVDDVEVATRGMTGQPPIEEQSKEVAFEGEIAPGCHLVRVRLDYVTRTPTPYGYDYPFLVTSVRAITLGASGGAVRLVSIDSRGGVTTPIEDRFAVAWDDSPL